MIKSLPNSALTAYPTKGKDPIFSVAGNQQIYVYNFRAANNSGGAINVGLCRKFDVANPGSSSYHLYQYTAVGPVITDKTSTIDAGTATVLFTTTNNDGIIVSGNRKFSMLGFTVSSASGGGTYTYKYWNGSSYTTLTTLEVPVYSATGDIWIVFQPPIDWAAGGSAGVDSSQYSLLIQATTHPTTAVSATDMWVAEFLEFYEGVSNNAVVQLSFPDSKPLLLRGGETLIPYFSTAAAANQAGAYYSFV